MGGPPAVSAITEAASVLLWRDADEPQLLVVRRSESLRFFGGYLAFPGGKLAPGGRLREPLTSSGSPDSAERI